MKLKSFLILTFIFLTSCQPQTIIPTSTLPPLPMETLPPLTTATLEPTPTIVPTFTAETPAATETATIAPTPSDVFGAIPVNSVQAFTLEPIAKAIFEKTLLKYVTNGTLHEFRVDSISVFPSSNGGLITEIMYSLRANADPWQEDGGTQNTDGWITGKCSRFDLTATETEQQLRNKRLCS